ncbi:MAG TPA: anti-sigma factor [Gammaproteobacteria bacterium]|jgi:anti-sigma-K factor RskA|nr:anti-sigma factor [Gammaproteobacteria bacterium]
MKYQDKRLHTLLAGEYVLGVLTGGARRRFERLLMERPALRSELSAWEERFAAWNLKLAPVDPPGYLWWRILGRVRADARPRREAVRNTFWRTWAVAATVVLAVLVVTQRILPSAEHKAAAFALVSDAKGQPLWLISVHPEANRIDMKAVSPNPPPAGKSYELWMLPGSGNPVPMGLMNSDGLASETVTPELLAKLAAAKGLAISLEPQGGSPTGLPTGPVLWTAAIVAT